MTRDQLQRRKEIKRAKKEWKETIDLNPTGFQKQRTELQRHAIDVKSKTRAGHLIEEIDSTRELINEVNGEPQSNNFYIKQYRGNYTLGYVCKLTCVLN